MKGPDVIVTVCERIAIFEPQNQQAADWLRLRCHTDMDNPLDQILLDSAQKREMVQALIAAGFTVWQ